MPRTPRQVRRCACDSFGNGTRPSLSADRWPQIALPRTGIHPHLCCSSCCPPYPPNRGPQPVERVGLRLRPTPVRSDPGARESRKSITACRVRGLSYYGIISRATVKRCHHVCNLVQDLPAPGSRRPSPPRGGHTGSWFREVRVLPHQHSTTAHRSEKSSWWKAQPLARDTQSSVLGRRTHVQAVERHAARSFERARPNRVSMAHSWRDIARGYRQRAEFVADAQAVRQHHDPRLKRPSQC
jgi:hypothetical protein